MNSEFPITNGGRGDLCPVYTSWTYRELRKRRLLKVRLHQRGFLQTFTCLSRSIKVCGRAEYEVEGECCPMCSAGKYVSKHCTEYSSTSCVSCPDLTFIDTPSGLINCRPCKVCDPRDGLKIERECTSISDTICEPLEGHYCIEKIKHGCRMAEEHSKCKPGQYIIQRGTPSTDTVCGDCVGETYSNGSFSSCQPYTQCRSMGLWERRPGTHSSDAECEERNIVPLVIGPLIGLIVLAMWGDLKSSEPPPSSPPLPIFWVGDLPSSQTRIRAPTPTRLTDSQGDMISLT
ncbi:tumor necrosis factor receptor superfamily member 14-like [Chanos chanos]|uniref:Tumor necrosis factor receptor superfamily member 14-like n=1 Tax=Chanos chanos TaxID=29144 RepID=A0A6J2WCM7_CHACN|nr:tumor necrosis factor receptor superfamily member 14-like [Chanos chanos]